jgi:CelD/BcsL family acetyltransferase involved in cellulose biosynthesis
MLHVRRVDRREELDCLGPEWNALVAVESAQALFSRSEWLRVWFEAFGAGSAPHVLVANRNGRPAGVLPLWAASERFAGLPIRRLGFMANGHSPRADLVTRPETEAEIAATFAHYLKEMDLDWDLAVFPEVESGSALDRLHDLFPPETRLRQLQRRAPYIRLDGGDWEGFRKSRSRNFQRVLRNNRNRFARAGASEVELLEAPQAIAAALDDMFAIGERSWQGEEGSAVGSSEANRRFYTGIVRELGPLGVVRLWFLKLAGRRIAFELHLVHAGTEFGLKTGFDREHETLGPGRFLDQAIVERLFAEGRVREYDLLGDADPYKLRWTQDVREYVRVTLFGSRVPSRLLSLWNLRLKPVLKQARDRARGTTASAVGAAAEADGEET